MVLPKHKPQRNIMQEDEALYKLRRQNLKRLIETYGSQAALGSKLGFSSGGNRISAIITGRRELTEKAARIYEKKLGLVRGWFDMDHEVSKDFDYLPDEVANDESGAYTRVVIELNKQIREKNISIDFEKFKKLANAACLMMGKYPCTAEEAVTKTLEIATLLS